MSFCTVSVRRASHFVKQLDLIFFFQIDSISFSTDDKENAHVLIQVQLTQL